MKQLITLIAAAFAVTAFAAEPAKKDEKKATKEAVKTDATKSVPATAPVAPAAKDQKAEAPKK